jgi:translocation and assembly module TamB
MRIVFRILAITVLVLAAVLLFVSATESGLRFAWKQLQSLLSPALTVQAVQGRLVGPLTVQGLQYRDESLQVTVQHAQLDWSLSRLLSGVLHVDRLSLDTVEYRVIEQTAPAEEDGFSLPERIALPVDVQIDELGVRALLIRADPASDGLILDHGQLRAAYHQGRLKLERLVISAPAFAVEGSAGLKTYGNYDLEAALNWRIHFDTYPDIEVQSELSGNLGRLTIVQTLGAPYSSVWDLAVSDLLGNPRIEGVVEIDDIYLKAIADELPAIVLRGPVAGTGPIADLDLSAELNVTSEAFPELDAAISATLLADAIQLKAVQLTSPVQDSRLNIEGRIGFASDLPFDLLAHWENLSWPLQAPHEVQSPAGDMKLAGNLDHYTVNTAFDLSLPAYTDAGVKLAGSGDLQSLAFSTVAIETLEGQLQGTADVAWAPDIRGGIDFKGESFNPAVLFADWPGRLGFDLKAQASWLAEGPDLRIHKLEVGGTLRDWPVHMQGGGQYRSGNWSIDNLALQSGQSSVQVRGEMGDTLDFQWSLNSPDLAALLPDASGRIEGTGSLQGRREVPQISASVSGSGLRYREHRTQSLALEADVDVSGKARSTIDLELGASHLGGIGLRSLELRGTGTAKRHDLRLLADGNEIKGDLYVNGEWQDDVWRFRLREAQLGYFELPPWMLDEPFQGRITRASVELSQSCWSSTDNARLCLQGNLSSEAGAGSFELEKLPFAYFANLLPADALLEGHINAHGEFRKDPRQALTAHVEADSESGKISPLDDARGQAAGLAFSKARLRLDVGENASRFSASAALENNGRLAVDAGLTGQGQPLLEQPLLGKALVEIPDMAFVTRFIPGTSDARGRMQGEVKITGSLASPVLTGELKVTDAAMVLDVPGVSLEDMSIRLRGSGAGDVAMDMRARSGAGQLSIEGTSNLITEPRTAQFTVRGKDVETLNTSEAKVITSPDLAVSLKGRAINIDGEVHVPSARIRPKTLSATSVQVSPDQVIIEDTVKPSIDERYQITSRVRFILGDRVEFDGFGLKGRLTGNVLTTDEPGRPTTASGELNIQEGKYRAYGQNLDIRTGRLLFAGGPVTEPGLDVEAVRRPAPDILVGVKARGSMRRPEFSVFSEPAMSQSNQLSWLILGRPIETGTTTQEQNTLNQTAVMLGLAGGVAITEQYGEQLGVDEISVESDPDATTNQASLLVGKYLSPKLFVSYGIGIFEPISMLRLRYALASRWTLVGEASSIRSSADLFYVIETGK